MVSAEAVSAEAVIAEAVIAEAASADAASAQAVRARAVETGAVGVKAVESRAAGCERAAVFSAGVVRGVCTVAVICGLSAGATAAESITGSFSVILESVDGATLEIGQLEVDAVSREFEPDENLFTNHFLSMRPFRCFDHDKVMWCHLPYPYEKPVAVTTGDLRSVEYDLLFIHRSANDYGIDAWNGLYFKMKPDSVNTAAGDTELVGELREVDLNILASPPENGVVWPITEEDLHVDESDRHVFSKIRLSQKGPE